VVAFTRRRVLSSLAASLGAVAAGASQLGASGTATAAKIKYALRRASMQFQVLDPLAINAQPVVDVGIFLSGITLLNLAETALIDSCENRRKRQSKDGTLRPPPASPISFAARKFCQLSMQLHGRASAILRNNPGP